MTEYFEVHHRDGPARLGELRLDDPVETPALVDEVIEDAGSLWSAHRPPPTGNDSKITVLPYRAFPRGTDSTISTAFGVDYPPVDYPSAAVISPETATMVGTDMYILGGGPGYYGHANAFASSIIAIREAIPDDTALYVPGIATAANVATLVFTGIDVFDTDRAFTRGLAGFYQTTYGELFLEDLSELPCACAACQTPRDEFGEVECANHNVALLLAQLSTVRERISQGRLRDYIEGQARHEAWVTALFRRLDQQYTYLESRTPIFRRSELLSASEDTLRRVEIQRFAERITSRYQCRLDAPLVLLPCSARKPYSESQSHKQFSRAIGYRGHIVSMTSPIGVVPNELETTYPAQHYDSVVTDSWSETEIAFVADVLSAYLNRIEYPEYIAHIPDGGYRDICNRVEQETGISFTYTVTDHPTTDDSLERLDAALDGKTPYQKQEREQATVRAIADYQFGENAGDELFESIQIGGRYPSFRIHTTENVQLATMVPQYGVLALTLAGAHRWHESDIPTKSVEIDDFIPSGSVLAPGVHSADQSIRPGDEVLIRGPRAFGVGRATCHGSAMGDATRGIVVDVRHVAER